MNEKQLIREFFEKSRADVCLSCSQNPCRCVELCGECNCDPCQCPGHQEDYSLDSMDYGEAHHEMELNDDGTISPHELFHHFDLDDDGKVTPQEYVDHIEYHASNPDTLDHYKDLRTQSINNVPCQSSYNNCSQHLLSNPNDIDKYLTPLMDMTGSSCKHSSMQSIIDVLQSLIKCGVF